MDLKRYKDEIQKVYISFEMCHFGADLSSSPM